MMGAKTQNIIYVLSVFVMMWSKSLLDILFNRREVKIMSGKKGKSAKQERVRVFLVGLKGESPTIKPFSLSKLSRDKKKYTVLVFSR